MKRLLYFLTLLCLTGLFAACGQTAVTSESNTTEQSDMQSTAQASKITTEADTTYEDVLYDTTPITQTVGEPLEVRWNPYLFSPLVDESYQKAFENTVYALLNRRLTVKFQTKNELLSVKDNLFYEFPPSALASWEADEEALTLRFTYRYGRDEYLDKLAAFGRLVEDILRDRLVYGDGEAEKALLLYHYIARNVSYYTVDFEDYQTNAYYALTEKKGICYSFSDAYNYLLRQVGVEAYLVKGYRATDRADHGWSLIKVDGHYYHCDTTWERSYLSGVGFYYFGMNDTRRANAIALKDAAVGNGILHKPLNLNAAGNQFNAISGDKIRKNTWTLDREKRVIHYNGKEYSYR